MTKKELINSLNGFSDDLQIDISLREDGIWRDIIVDKENSILVFPKWGNGVPKKFKNGDVVTYEECTSIHVMISVIK